MNANDGIKELELIDLISIIYNKKWIVVSVILATAMLTIPILYSLPKQYRANMIINTRTLRTKEGQFVPIDKPENIIELIESGTFSSDIMDLIGGTNRDLLKFKTSHEKGEFSIDIAYYTSNPEEGLKVLSLLSEKLKERYEGIVNSINEDIDYKIQTLNLEMVLNKKKIDAEKINAVYLEKDFISNQKTIDNMIHLKEREIELSTLKVKDLRRKIDNINSQIQMIIRNIPKLNEQISNSKSISEIDKNFILKGLADQDVFNIYELTKNLYDSLSETNQRIYEEQLWIASTENEIKNEIEKKETQKRDYEDKKAVNENMIIELNQQNKIIEMQKLSTESIRKNTSNLEILQSPKISKYPVKPKKKIILIIVMTIVLIATIFFIMFQEYLKRTSRSGFDVNQPQLPK